MKDITPNMIWIAAKSNANLLANVLSYFFHLMHFAPLCRSLAFCCLCHKLLPLLAITTTNEEIWQWQLAASNSNAFLSQQLVILTGVCSQSADFLSSFYGQFLDFEAKNWGRFLYLLKLRISLCLLSFCPEAILKWTAFLYLFISLWHSDVFWKESAHLNSKTCHEYVRHTKDSWDDWKVTILHFDVN